MSTYTLSKGNHYANGLHFGVHFGITSRTYKVTFSKECLYTPLDWENDYNKLCGWSYGMHHNNSIRVCWRPFVPVEYVNDVHFKPSLLELCIYVYENGVRTITDQNRVVQADKEFVFTLQYIDKGVLFKFENDISPAMMLQYSTKPKWGYNLYPFFGGNLSSPHDMTIKLETL